MSSLSPPSPCYFIKLPEEMQQNIWRFTLPAFTIHYVVIEIKDSNNQWCKAHPDDRPALYDFWPIHKGRSIYRWRQLIKSPRRPAGLDVCKASRRIMLPWFREFRRSCIRQVLQSDEGEDYVLDSDDPSRGSPVLGLCNPLTDLLYVNGEIAMFPLNLREFPILNVSVQLPEEGNGSLGHSLDCSYLTRCVLPHYSPRLSYIHAVLSWCNGDLASEHHQCNWTIPVGKPVAWTRNDGRAKAMAIRNWGSIYYGPGNHRIALEGQFSGEDVTILPDSDTKTHTMLVLATMPMSCKCPGMVEAMTIRAASLTDKERATIHPTWVFVPESPGMRWI
ncbi:hypothetical protein F53441_12710 [Fusarium austroafricanum]|uniref:2EXR domain-containing protein n=1 Tax=Fusarium austroafricanum TaxID=2364996 RepID=A0A8H4JTL4_9HYPO|nr:hypothetical protein F53441_12710 [Fusarium austroafricanum]